MPLSADIVGRYIKKTQQHAACIRTNYVGGLLWNFLKVHVFWHASAYGICQILFNNEIHKELFSFGPIK